MAIARVNHPCSVHVLGALLLCAALVIPMAQIAADPEECITYCDPEDPPAPAMTACGLCVKTVRDCSPQDGVSAQVWWRVYPDGEWHGPYYSCSGSDYTLCFQWPQAGTYQVCALGCWLGAGQGWYPNCCHVVTLGSGQYVLRKCVICSCLPQPYSLPEFP
jgi:hypothetical protein